MTSAGIRELRQRASELLRRVEQGETIEITDRGRPVAVLAPPLGTRSVDPEIRTIESRCVASLDALLDV